MPAAEMFQLAKVPDPEIRVTLTVSVVPVYEVTWPSIQLVGVTEYEMRTYCPATYAKFA